MIIFVGAEFSWYLRCNYLKQVVTTTVTTVSYLQQTGRHCKLLDSYIVTGGLFVKVFGSLLKVSKFSGLTRSSGSVHKVIICFYLRHVG